MQKWEYAVFYWQGPGDEELRQVGFTHQKRWDLSKKTPFAIHSSGLAMRGGSSSKSYRMGPIQTRERITLSAHRNHSHRHRHSR